MCLSECALECSRLAADCFLTDVAAQCRAVRDDFEEILHDRREQQDVGSRGNRRWTWYVHGDSGRGVLLSADARVVIKLFDVIDRLAARDPQVLLEARREHDAHRVTSVQGLQPELQLLHRLRRQARRRRRGRSHGRFEEEQSRAHGASRQERYVCVYLYSNVRARTLPSQ